jgi:hypothetical protein
VKLKRLHWAGYLIRMLRCRVIYWRHLHVSFMCTSLSVHTLHFCIVIYMFFDKFVHRGIRWYFFIGKSLYCHVWGVCVTDKNGFWIGWLNLLALLYNYNQLRQLTINNCLRLAPFITGVFSTVTTHERRIHAHTLNCLERPLSDESLLNDSHVSSLFITSAEPNRGHHLEQLVYFVIVSVLSVAKKRRKLLLINGGPTVDCLTSRIHT